MTFKREDERHARGELERLFDKLAEVQETMHELADDLRIDDPVTTIAARNALANARIAVGAARAQVLAAGALLPAPVVETARRV